MLCIGCICMSWYVICVLKKGKEHEIGRYRVGVGGWVGGGAYMYIYIYIHTYTYIRTYHMFMFLLCFSVCFPVLSLVVINFVFQISDGHTLF